MKNLFLNIFIVFLVASCFNSKAKPYIDLQKRSNSNIDTFLIENTDSLKRYATTWKETTYWQEIEVDTLMKYNAVFKKLDSLPELQQMFNKLVAGQKRSAHIKHYITQEGYVNDSTNAFFTNDIGEFAICKAYQGIKENTLIVDLGFSTGFSGWGFTIHVFSKKFITTPYYFDDVITRNEKDPLNYPFFQKLVLNKQQYNLGDSIWGYVKFSSVFYNEYGDPSKHNTDGYFRGRVEKEPQ